jgi:hypothetical protein
VFNVLAVATFLGLAIAVFIAIERGMGVHVEVVLYERGFQGLSDYNQVSAANRIFIISC